MFTPRSLVLGTRIQKSSAACLVQPCPPHSVKFAQPQFSINPNDERGSRFGHALRRGVGVPELLQTTKWKFPNRGDPSIDPPNLIILFMGPPKMVPRKIPGTYQMGRCK